MCIVAGVGVTIYGLFSLGWIKVGILPHSRCNFVNASGLSNNRGKEYFPGTVGNIGVSWEIPRNTEKYREKVKYDIDIAICCVACTCLYVTCLRKI